MENKTPKQTDEELVLLAQAGDKRAEETLLIRHSEIVRKKARKFFLLGGDTDDLVQVGMIGLYSAIGSYASGEGASFQTFAEQCINRRLSDAVKKENRKKNEILKRCVYLSEDILDLGLSPEELLIARENMREFNMKMGKTLSNFEFKIMKYYADGMTMSEICEATGKPFKSVDNAIQRSKRKLQALVER
jgi:RNA polymerase sporulation-specific sigma factor